MTFQNVTSKKITLNLVCAIMVYRFQVKTFFGAVFNQILRSQFRIASQFQVHRVMISISVHVNNITAFLYLCYKQCWGNIVNLSSVSIMCRVIHNHMYDVSLLDGFIWL